MQLILSGYPLDAAKLVIKKMEIKPFYKKVILIKLINYCIDIRSPILAKLMHYFYQMLDGSTTGQLNWMISHVHPYLRVILSLLFIEKLALDEKPKLESLYRLHNIIKRVLIDMKPISIKCEPNEKEYLEKFAKPIRLRVLALLRLRLLKQQGNEWKMYNELVSYYEYIIKEGKTKPLQISLSEIDRKIQASVVSSLVAFKTCTPSYRRIVCDINKKLNKASNDIKSFIGHDLELILNKENGYWNQSVPFKQHRSSKLRCKDMNANKYIWHSIYQFLNIPKKQINPTSLIHKVRVCEKSIQAGLGCASTLNINKLCKNLSLEMLHNWTRKYSKKIIKNSYYSILIYSAETKVTNKPKHKKSNTNIFIEPFSKVSTMTKMHSKRVSGYSTPGGPLLCISTVNKKEKASSQMPSPTSSKIAYKFIMLPKESRAIIRKIRYEDIR
jgi:hypothetical protein